MTIQEELKLRELPELLLMEDGSRVSNTGMWEKRRIEIKQMLFREYAGYFPEFAVKTEGVCIRADEAFGGKAVRSMIELKFSTAFKTFVMSFTLLVPKLKAHESFPAFVYLGFDSLPADGIGEEITDNGYAVAHINYQDIVPDRCDDFLNGLGTFCSRNNFDSWGKLGMWAYGAQRVMDYLLERDDIDSARIGIMGHSRLGKAALWCGAADERFSIVISNDSGGGGAALFRGKTGERLKDLNGSISRMWFCGNLFNYIGREEKMPFDQHFLLALMAPRHLYIASASEDDWADPRSELLSAAAASEAFELYGKKGLICSENIMTGMGYHDGDIGYHMRRGTHFLSREDWKLVIDYRNRHGV